LRPKDRKAATVGVGTPVNRLAGVIVINGSSLRKGSKNILSVGEKFARISAARVKDSPDIKADPEQPFHLLRSSHTRAVTDATCPSIFPEDN